MKNSKPKRKPTPKSFSGKPATPVKSAAVVTGRVGEPPPELVSRAAAIDDKIKAESGGADSAAAVLSGGAPAHEEPQGRGGARPGAGRKKKDAAPEVAGPSEDEKLIGSMVTSLTMWGVSFAKASGWSAPISGEMVDGKLILSEEVWLKQVQAAELALIRKYAPVAGEYGAELALAALVLPWAIDNIMRSLSKARKEKAAVGQDNSNNRIDGDGKDNTNGPSDPPPS